MIVFAFYGSPRMPLVRRNVYVPRQTRYRSCAVEDLSRFWNSLKGVQSEAEDSFLSLRSI